MQFNESQPIYLQIARYASEKIILKEWRTEDRVPSVRDLAVELQVNPNTVARTFDFLQQRSIISNTRGVGYFVTTAARQNALTWLKEEFTEKEMNSFFKSMVLLDLEVEDIIPYFQKFKRKHSLQTKKRV
jgi:DNA-binding transcriptional regulator YhcF (GntR family)